jgi:hypothetical protein
MSALKDLSRRLACGWRWIAAQFGGMLLLVLLGLGWTRLPDQHAWQVLLSLLLPPVLIATALMLQAATMRAFLGSEQNRIKLAWGALTLLVWIAVVCAFWWLLDWCDDHFWDWASYLNSKAPAHWRARILTYQHIYRWLVTAEWILRWIVTPAKVIPLAMASAQWGVRLRWRRVLHLLWNWRWWLVVALAACAAILLPGHLFAGLPHGTVSHQVLSVILKLFVSWILALGSWVILLAWAAVIMVPQSNAGPSDDGEEDALVTVAPPGGPLSRHDAVNLPLPESGDHSGGNS